MMNLDLCYEQLGLRENPFSITPDSHYFYASEDHMQALFHMLHGVSCGGFTLITGEVGLGKTLLCRQLIKNLPPNTACAYVFNPLRNSQDLLRSIYHDLGGEKLPDDAIGELHQSLYQRLLDLAESGRQAVIIIDEAHRLEAEVLESIRLISNLETEKRKLVSVILVGQPELNDTLASRRMRPLTQRIANRYKLSHLRHTEAVNYIRHRLHQADNRHIQFSLAALHLASRLSGGVPRRLNQICDRALLATFASQTSTLTANAIWRAHREVTG